MIMKRILILAMAFLLLTSCEDLSVKVDDLESRIDQLEEICNNINNDIASLNRLVEAINTNNYITSVEPITKDGEVIGYTIHFMKGDPIQIYHGKDGTDGKVPPISVMKDSDGNYYWALNGEFLLDDSGNKIPATGNVGTDSVSPKLKLENDWWYISYDDGATWTYLGTASWIPSNSIFSDLEEVDGTVIFTLVDGRQIAVPVYHPIDVTLFDKNGNALDETEIFYIPVKSVGIVNYELSGTLSDAAVTVSTSGYYKVAVAHDPKNNNGTVSIEAPQTDVGIGTVNLIIYDNGYMFTKKITVGCLVPTSVSYRISGLSASTYNTESWDITFIEDFENRDRLWIDGIIPEFKGIAGFYGEVEYDENGQFKTIKLPIGQINTEIQDFYNFPNDGIVRLYGLDDYGMTLTEGEILIEFTNGATEISFPVNAPAVGGIGKYGSEMFYNGFFGGSFGDVHGNLIIR